MKPACCNLATILQTALKLHKLHLNCNCHICRQISVIVSCFNHDIMINYDSLDTCNAHLTKSAFNCIKPVNLQFIEDRMKYKQWKKTQH